MVAPALIAAGAQLLGGLLAPKPKYVVPDYQGIRDKAEAAGFNPLVALTQGPQGSVVQGGNVMGSAVADAGLMLADSLAKSKKTGVLSRVQSENARLRDQVTNMTLRPKVAGVYARQQSVPSVPSALGAGDGGGYSAVDRRDLSVVGSASAGVASGPNAPSSSSDDASKTPTLPLQFLGYQLRPQSQTSDAEAFASRYGEDFMSPSWFAGWTAFATDSALGLKDAAVERARRIGRAIQHDVHRLGPASSPGLTLNAYIAERERNMPPIGSTKQPVKLRPNGYGQGFRGATKALMAPRPSNYW